MDIVARAKGLLMDPMREWGIIAAEPADVAGLFKSYVVPLAAIPAVAGVIGTALMGFGVLGFGGLIGSAVVGYLLALVGIFVLAKIVELLAPRFGGPADPVAAIKLAAYAPTASWVGGAFMIIPWIGWIPALAGGLYSLFLFYVGTPTVMRIPKDRVMGFALSVVLVAVLVNILIGAIISILF
ncbi:Yip1 family protein [Sediminicoccus sp. KRV36]|uniref:Yip1 family protein n=1 Tax=Sediminicoccus sp. KRV36 TaxID=3133721 RepID=UPI00200BE111|nr:Yip1 family protein [Sediminicoccus rosea]UPY35738.1 YIP1 family protein [Sediminicoccus rosea]